MVKLVGVHVRDFLVRKGEVDITLACGSNNGQARHPAAEGSRQNAGVDQAFPDSF